MNIDEDGGLTGAVIGAAIAVHRELGPGLDEKPYEEALSIKLAALGTPHERQKAMPLSYKGITLDCGFRVDVIVDDRLPLELKAVDVILPIHEAQLLTYMRLGGWPLGLLVNFEVTMLKDGVRRRVLTRAGTLLSQSPPEPPPGHDSLSTELFEAASEVRRTLGPGLLRSAYEECLCQELKLREIPFVRQHRAPLRFEGHNLTHCAEIPLVIAGRLPVYCLSVAALTSLHESRLLARMRQAGWPNGFLINFNAPSPGRGIRCLTCA